MSFSAEKLGNPKTFINAIMGSPKLCFEDDGKKLQAAGLKITEKTPSRWLEDDGKNSKFCNFKMT